MPVILIVIFVLALLSFMFSASETAIIGINKIRLRHMLAKGVRRAKRVQQLIVKLDKLIAAILIGNNFVNIAISAIVTALFVQIFGYRWGMIAATFATTIFVLVFCEITPKILATKYAEKIALICAPVMEVLVKILHPLILVFTAVTNLILKVFGVAAPKRSPLVTEEELRTMIEVGREEGFLSEEERKMLHRIFEFGDTKVSDVMVPRDSIVAINAKASPDDLLDIFAEQGHARLPVYESSVDNIIGVIYARDLLYILRDKQLFLLQDLIHPPYLASGKTRVNELLREFQARKIQLAIVVDDKNKAVGLVTLEDLIEEIVGEIEEQHSSRSGK